MRFRGVNGLRFDVSWSAYLLPRSERRSRIGIMFHVEHCIAKFAQTVVYVYYR